MIKKKFDGLAGDKQLTVEVCTPTKDIKTFNSVNTVYLASKIQVVGDGRSVKDDNGKWVIDEGNGQYTPCTIDGLSAYIEKLKNS